MKRTIFLYLFLFAALWIVFQFVHNKKYSENAEKRITKLENKLAQKDSIAKAQKDNVLALNGFALAANVNAQEYYEDSEMAVEAIVIKVIDAVIEKNTAKGNDLISYQGDTRPYLINSVHVLNHRWLIADFTDNNTWGEILIKYFINDDGSMDFEVVEELLY